MEITLSYLFDAESRRNSQEDPEEAWRLQFQSVSLTSHGKCLCLSSRSFEKGYDKPKGSEKGKWPESSQKKPYRAATSECKVGGVMELKTKEDFEK
jgi:hypothetical protein